MSKKLISIIIPAFDEEGNVNEIYHAVRREIPQKYAFEIIYVDDGSKDGTLSKIKKLAAKNASVKYLSFTRNFGHQYALKAGLDYASGEAAITLDADLQHPPELIPQMLIEWEKGIKIVNTVRKNNEGWGKNTSSTLFYKLINLLSETKIEPSAADYRLLDKEVVELVKGSQESTLFLRGLVAWTGYKSATLPYQPNKRRHGQTKYSYSRMLSFAVDAITSFSTIPLRLATLLGLVISFFSGIYGLYAVIAFITHKESVIVGWPSVIISVLFIGGIQLMILGILGEYLGKIFIESKNRPLYLVKEKSL